MAKKYYVEYLKLIKHYGKLVKPLETLWKNYEKNPNFRP